MAPRFLAVPMVLAIAGAAMADTAYIEPSTFAPRLEQTITIETSFNDYCCVPKYPVRSEAFTVIQPDGQPVEPDRIELFANGTVLEQKVVSSGTTRITTGERLGRKGGEYVLLDGQYFMINSDEAEPIEVPDARRSFRLKQQRFRIPMSRLAIRPGRAFACRSGGLPFCRKSIPRP